MSALHTIEKLSSGMHFISLTDKEVASFIKKGHKRVVCIWNNSVNTHSALLHSKQHGYHITIGQKTLKQLNLREGQPVRIALTEDNTADQFFVPEAWHEVIASDPEAQAAYDKLTPGARRTVLHWIQQAKSTDKQIERSLRIATRLKQGMTSVREIIKA
jgi:hypothetical protein